MRRKHNLDVDSTTKLNNSQKYEIVFKESMINQVDMIKTISTNWSKCFCNFTFIE